MAKRNVEMMKEAGDATRGTSNVFADVVRGTATDLKNTLRNLNL